MQLKYAFRRGQRSQVARPPRSAAQQERHQLGHLWIAGLALAVSLWVVLAVRPPATPGLRPGTVSPVSIQAERDVEFTSTLRTEEERAQAESDPSNIKFTIDPSIPISQRQALTNLLQTITRIRDDQSLNGAEELDRLTNLPNTTLLISSTLARQIAELSDVEWGVVRQGALDLYNQALRERNFELTDQAINDLRVRSLPYWSSLYYEGVRRDLVLLFSSSFLKTNRIPDEAATLRAKELARGEVEPVIVRIQRGESIVREGAIVTPEVQEMLEAVGQLPSTTNWLEIGGKALLAALVAGLFSVYIGLTQRQIWLDDRPLLVVFGMVVLTVLAARLVFGLPLGPIGPYVFPLAAVALLLAALFNSALALVAAALLSLLLAFVGSRDFGLAAAQLLGCMAGVFVLGRADRSLTFLLAGLVTGGVVVLTRAALWLMTFGDPVLMDLAQIVAFGLLNGSIAAVLALGLYNLVGHMAGLATPFQLMELGHPAQPLLRKLIREAPGTYYHSVAVGNLAESAAEAIGADALLLRVAAYYHDIGKSIRPYFFSDNQSDRENVHNELDPRTSAEIIAAHVSEGVSMARAIGLPRQVIDFIRTHHGTTVITHFYQVALQQEDSVNLEDYRYPGPKPQTREHAILMLADSVEATVRAKAQHGKLVGGNGSGVSGRQLLEDLVNSIIDERLRSGQLDESPLTLQDVARIRQAFIKTLHGIYHPRVEYAAQVVRQ